MELAPNVYHGKLAVRCDTDQDLPVLQGLSQRLGIPIRNAKELPAEPLEPWFLICRQGKLQLLDADFPHALGLTVDIEPRPGEQRSWPAPKQGPLAQALGRKTRTVIDATTGWGQDALHIFRMGYQINCLERSPVMAELLADGFKRLADLDWMQRLELKPPTLIHRNAIEYLAELPSAPDCIYLDPMFPPKRKKSALAKKSLRALRDLLGDDEDKSQLFAAAMAAAGKRVVVKGPDDAEPLGGPPNVCVRSKLLRYDIYLKN